ncbi:FAD binding domain-containing protein [Bradyrhizobium sp. USDA 4454]
MMSGSPVQNSAVGTRDASTSIYVAPSLTAALDALSEHGAAGAPFAGGTWIMRSPLRHQPLKTHYVAIGRIAEMTAVRIGSDAIEIGAAVTHAALAAALAGHPELAGLAAAAGHSANPAIRAMATIGGNLATSEFAAADCVPALLCLDADVEISDRGGREYLSLTDFLNIRSTLAPGRLVTRIILPRIERKTAHVRLPLRRSGDYPVAIVSMSVSLDAASRVQAARIAVGSIEATARRWPRLEAALLGRPLDAAEAARGAAELSDEFAGRDSVDAPAWYRVSVLPGLVRRAAIAALSS